MRITAGADSRRSHFGEARKKKEREEMSRNWMKTAQLCVGIVAFGWASSLTATPKPLQNTAHPVAVTVANRTGDSIRGDGLVYTDGIDAGARLWDMVNGVADHLYFQVDQKTNGRTLTLTIPGLTNGTETCAVGTLQPNQNDNNYQFYNNYLFPIGASTDQPDVNDPTRSNFGGTFKCLDSRGRYGWIVTYVTQCIVIAHTATGEWTVTMDGGSCPAAVSKVTNGAVTGQGNHDVPFQVHAKELP
ncbi:MAG: hypothetical protein ABJC61_00435 [Acidobacteriota bacterium]